MEMKIRKKIILPLHSVASLSLKGLMGDRVIRILPGSSKMKIAPNGVLMNTESGMDITDLIGHVLSGKM